MLMILVVIWSQYVFNLKKIYSQQRNIHIHTFCIWLITVVFIIFFESQSALPLYTKWLSELILVIWAAQKNSFIAIRSFVANGVSDQRGWREQTQQLGCRYWKVRPVYIED